MTAAQLYSHVLELFDGRARGGDTDGSCRLADLATCACFYAARGDWERAAERLRLLSEEDAPEHRARWRDLAERAVRRDAA